MLQYAVPPGYQRQQPIKRPKLGPWLGVIDAILEDDRQRPAKQRHTAKRIFERLKEEQGMHGFLNQEMYCFCTADVPIRAILAISEDVVGGKGEVK
jgi:transposase